MRLEKQRQQVVEYCQLLIPRGLTKGTGGNISVLEPQSGLMAISPSGMDYTEMNPADVVVMELDGRVVEGEFSPSSEWMMHAECYKQRPDCTAVVHTHSTYCATLACMMEPIPPVHYLIGFAGGTVECAPYHLFGSEELAHAAAPYLKERNAVLLGHHGLLCTGKDIAMAFATAEETEFVAEIYYNMKALGRADTLSPEELDAAMVRFGTYGQMQSH